MAACLNPQFRLDVKEKSHLFMQQIMVLVLQTSPRYPLYANVNQDLSQKSSWLGDVLSPKT